MPPQTLCVYHLVVRRERSCRPQSCGMDPLPGAVSHSPVTRRRANLQFCLSQSHPVSPCCRRHGFSRPRLLTVESTHHPAQGWGKRGLVLSTSPFGNGCLSGRLGNLRLSPHMSSAVTDLSSCVESPASICLGILFMHLILVRGPPPLLL